MIEKKIIVKKFLYLISLCILLNLGLGIALNSASNIFNNEDFITNWGWLYAAIYIYITFLFVKKALLRWEINLLRLVYIKIALALFLYVIVFKLNVTPIWNFHTYNFTLIDDKEYQEDPYADDDPIYGRDESGYVSTYKYFLPISTQLEGLILPIGIINKDLKSQYYIVDKYENEYPVNISYSIFWQFAYIDGYIPIQKKDYQINGFIKRIYQIGPYFLFELILTNLGSTFLFTIIVLIISVFSSTFFISFIDYSELGLSKYNQKDYYGAISIFDKAIRSDSRNPSYHYNRGIAKLAKENFKDAFQDFDNAIQLKPNDESYYYNRGLTNYNLRKYENAIADFGQAVLINPGIAEYQYYLGLSKYFLNDYYGAISFHNKAIEIDPMYLFAYWNRGNAKDCLKDYIGALEDFNKVIELNPQYESAYYNRGRTKYSLKDYDGALVDFNSAIEINPKKNSYFSYRGLSKYQLKDYNGSIEDYNKTIELKPEDPIPFCNRGLSKYYIKDFKGAIDDYNKAIELDPSITLPSYLEPYQEATIEDVTRMLPTRKTPEVILDKAGNIKIRGWSIPEDGVPFYEPIMNWINEYIQNPASVTCIDINLQSINGVSRKYLVQIIQKITYVSLKQKKFIINWYFENDDTEILAIGEDLSFVLDVPFNYIKIT